MYELLAPFILSTHHLNHPMWGRDLSPQTGQLGCLLRISAWPHVTLHTSGLPSLGLSLLTCKMG